MAVSSSSAATPEEIDLLPVLEAEAGTSVLEELWENQRWAPRRGWSSGNRLATDRPGWSDRKGSRALAKDAFLLPPDGWRWRGGWRTEPHGDQSEGWYYAVDFTVPTRHCSKKSGPLAMVRRRKWVRERVVVHAPALTPETATTLARITDPSAGHYAERVGYGFAGITADAVAADMARQHRAFAVFQSVAASFYEVRGHGEASPVLSLSSSHLKHVYDHGFPQALRGVLWLALSGAHEKRICAAGYYRELSAAAMSAAVAVRNATPGTSPCAVPEASPGPPSVFGSAPQDTAAGVFAATAPTTASEIAVEAVAALESPPKPAPPPVDPDRRVGAASAASLAQSFVHIRQDVSRTAPAHPFFAYEAWTGQALAEPLGRGSKAMERVLVALAAHTGRPYHQAYSCVAAAVVLSVPDEESAFWLLESLLADGGVLPPSYFDDNLVLADVALSVELIHAALPPAASAALKQRHVDFSVFVGGWLQALFTAHFPLATACRVLDIILAEGTNAVLPRIVAAFGRQHADEIAALSDSGTAGIYANRWARGLHDPDAVFTTVRKDGLKAQVLARREVLMQQQAAVGALHH